MIADRVAVLLAAAPRDRARGEEQRLEQGRLAGEIGPYQRRAARPRLSAIMCFGHARLLRIVRDVAHSLEERATALETPLGHDGCAMRRPWQLESSGAVAAPAPLSRLLRRQSSLKCVAKQTGLRPGEQGEDHDAASGAGTLAPEFAFLPMTAALFIEQVFNGVQFGLMLYLM